MLVCNCSLAGTSACKTCNRYIEEFGCTSPNYMPQYIYKESIKEEHKPIIQYLCPECRTTVDRFDKFCRSCGNKLDWERFDICERGEYV